MLNSNEIRLLLSELPLEGSFIQKVTEHDFHSFTLSLFHREEKAWLLYVETGTKYQHFCRTELMRKKSPKAQRFTQYLRSNLVGSRIQEVWQVPGDRTVRLTLTHDGEVLLLWLRFFSGPGSNVFITDSDGYILEAQMRRPQRDESKGGHLESPVGRPWDEERFPIRQWEGPSFNAFIDEWYSDEAKRDLTGDTLAKLTLQRDRELSALRGQVRDVTRRVEQSKDSESLKLTGDILSANAWALKRGMDEAHVYDFDGNEVVISLDSSLSPSENINAFYQKYKRQQRIHQAALEELEAIQEQLAKRTAYYDELLARAELGPLRKALVKQDSPKAQQKAIPGLRFTSHGFELLVGRNAKENDELLRHHCRSNDLWMHTRDHAGGYVIIKALKGKSVPLDVLLDAGNLAIHYSKAKSQGRADLYYTQVKFLRRIKDGKTGLVTPTQEKNLHVVVDESRLSGLLLQKEAFS